MVHQRSQWLKVLDEVIVDRPHLFLQAGTPLNLVAGKLGVANDMPHPRLDKR